MTDSIPLSGLTVRAGTEIDSTLPNHEEAQDAPTGTSNQSKLGESFPSGPSTESSSGNTSLNPQDVFGRPIEVVRLPREGDETSALRNPISMLGKAVKSQLSSDLTTGIFALLGFLCAVLVGVWGILLARQQLDLGKWSFCKTYPNDTQVLQSSTCQRYAEKSSLDDLNRRDGSDQRHSPSTSPAFVLDTVPSWIIPPTVEKSSCNVVCWNLAPAAVIEERIETELKLDRVTKLSHQMSILVFVNILTTLPLYAYREYVQRLGRFPPRSLAKFTFRQTMIQDVKAIKNALLRLTPGICFNTVLLGIFILGYIPDSRSAVEALITLGRLWLSQMLIMAISSFIGFADIQDTVLFYLSNFWKPALKVSGQWILPPIFVVIYLATGNAGSVAKFLFSLSSINLCFRALQLTGDVRREHVLLEEPRQCEVHQVSTD